MTESDKWRLLAWALVALLLAWAAVRMLGPREPSAAPVRVERHEGGATRSQRGGVYVHVAGAVRRPGLLRLASGARVAEAIERAGGPLRRADLTGVNLAQPLEDGRQVIVPVRGAAAAGPGSGSVGPAASGASVPSLATATVEQLDGLDGIGPTLAKRIVDYREAHGGFRSVEELREVDGIGEKRFATLRELLRP